MRHRRGMHGLGALFDPTKGQKADTVVSSEVGAVISNFLGTDKGDPRFVYGGCPKDVKTELEAQAKCRFASDRSSIVVRVGNSLQTAAARVANGAVVSIDPGAVNADKAQRAVANAVLRALNAGVQVEDRALIKAKERSFGGAVLSTGSGGRVLVQGNLRVPLTVEAIKASLRPVGAPSAALFDPASMTLGDFENILASKKKGKKRRKSRK